jgi:hypothetical protein
MLGLGIFIVVWVGIMVGIMTIAARVEARHWNSGYCSCCRRPWVFFDRDSHGGRGYKCGCGNYVWVSYPVDRVVAVRAEASKDASEKTSSCKRVGVLRRLFGRE